MTQIQEPLRVAFVGTGGIANAHAEALQQQPGVELTVAIDLDAGRAQAFAEKWDVKRTAGSLAEAAGGGPLDLVAICTPPSSHYPLALEALSLGLHAVIEKPPALSLGQMRELQAAEAASAGTLSCVFQHRFGSGARRLQSLQHSGVLGRPLVGTCNTLWFRNQAYFDVPWRGLWDVEGGGPTMGHGIHQFDLLLHLWGPWAKVTAFAGKLARKTDTEDASAAVVRFESGAIATIINSVISPRETSYMRLDFENATVELEHLYGYSDTNWTVTPAPGQEELANAWSQGQDVASGHAAQYEALIRSLRAGEHPPVSVADAYATMELAAAIYASSVSGSTVARGQIDEPHPFFTRMDGHLEPWKQEEALNA
ncbi:Gfo/Idh/MocA family protein [Arthrobacter nitrophenolicus]|uniref:Gfo/Idh/MocA family oxidoreductase n=1 Tax=Arthrobacter nitrophenolicus TaxID=683150 RepID=A0A4R5Y555_9MICC|nr:Gfo/Idh/MocA family oxidoreductase [Arthrobacter nitrophenolicus]TDL39710.1 Gfo/Idh/MocA family oxidoreductase [Arthrobacter nitrophenolicus]